MTSRLLATTDRRAIARAFGTTTKPMTETLLTQAFPIRGTSPANRDLLRQQGWHRGADCERSKKHCDCASAKLGAKQVRGKGESRTSWAGVNDERVQEPGGGEADGPQERREGGLTSTPRQYPLWERRGGSGRMTMISRSVEISIAGGRGEVPSVGHFSFSFFLFISCINCLWYKNSHVALAMA